MEKFGVILSLFFSWLSSSQALASSYSEICPIAESKKIASYNIHQESWMDVPKYWKFRATEVQTVLRSLDADIIHLQEVSPDRYEALQKALPQFQLWKGEGGLASLVRGTHWTVLSNKSLLAHEELAVQELRLLPHQTYDKEPKILWNVWLHPKTWTPTQVSETLAKILQQHSERPQAIALSLRAPDRQHHDRHSWHELLRQFQLRQADPQSFAITTNGWWATKWTTEDWHDAILSQRAWVLAKSELVRQKVGGVYPSMHFPLVTHFCPRRELIVEQMSP